MDYRIKIYFNRIIFENNNFLAKSRASLSIIKNNRVYCMNIFHSVINILYLFRYEKNYIADFL